jgi:hypothetical protein
MTIRQPGESDMLRDFGREDEEMTFSVLGGIGIPFPREARAALLSSSGLPLGLIGRPQLGVRPEWHRYEDPITGEVAWVLCFDCARHW